MNCWLYRLRQGWRQLVHTQVAKADLLATAHLSGAPLSLFLRMSPGDRDHAGCVLTRLQETGVISLELAQAALLHDCGKVQAKLTIVHRSIIVILRRLAPGVWHAFSSRDSPPWRRTFYLSARHAAIGAELAAQAGCSQRTIWLISHHDLPASTGAGMITDGELEALQQADNAC